MNTRNPNFRQGYRLTSTALELGRFTVSELQSITGVGVNTIYSFINRLENAGEGLLESAPVATMDRRSGAPRKQYWLTEAGANYLARMSFRQAAQFGAPADAPLQQQEKQATSESKIAPYLFPLVDIYDQGTEIVIQAEVPGVSENDLLVDIQGNTLTITGERKLWDEGRHKHFQLRECRYGRFSRSFNLSAAIDVGSSHAGFKDGVLSVTLRKMEGGRAEIRGSEPLSRSGILSSALRDVEQLRVKNG